MFYLKIDSPKHSLQREGDLVMVTRKSRESVGDIPGSE